MKSQHKQKRNIQIKLYFQFIISENNYIKIDEANESIENLALMTSKRKECNIFLLTSNHFRLVAAKENGFCIIPIAKFCSNMENDVQLNLVENYLLLLKYTNDMKSKNNIDFGYLTSSPMINQMRRVNY